MEPDTVSYNPHKIPVLFVHGAVGTPRDFAVIAKAIDRNHYQPWYFYYPSGVRLGNVVDALVETVERLRDKYDFGSMIVTAHSMGGLVSRGFINKFTRSGNAAVIPLFVSISTPWGGSRLAAKGAAQAPVAVPSWYDMAPQSEFIELLFAMPLAAVVKHHLFFGFKGDCSMFMDNNDGSVELESELDYRAQNEAIAIFGLNEDHTSILQSKELLEHYRRILEDMALAR